MAPGSAGDKCDKGGKLLLGELLAPRAALRGLMQFSFSITNASSLSYQKLSSLSYKTAYIFLNFFSIQSVIFIRENAVLKLLQGEPCVGTHAWHGAETKG